MKKLPMPTVIELVKENNLEEIQKLFDKNPKLDLNEVDNNNCTALMHAAQLGYFEIAEWLLKHDVNVSLKNIWNYSAIVYSLSPEISPKSENHQKIFELLKKYPTSGLSEIPELWLTAASNDVAELRHFTQEEFNESTYLYFSPLHVAILNNYKNVLNLLLEILADNAIKEIVKPIVDGEFKNFSALHMAIWFCDTKVLQMLIPVLIECLGPQQAAAEIVKPIVDGRFKNFSALHLAIYVGYTEVLQELIKCLEPQQAVAEIVKPIVDGEFKNFSAFYIAVYMGHTEILQILIECLGLQQAVEEIVKPIVDDSELKGYYALHIAVRAGHTEILQFLIECLGPQQAAAEIVKPIVDGRFKNFSAFHIAVYMGLTEILQILIECLGPQQAAAEIVKLIVDGECKDFSALHMAILNDHTEVLHELIKCLGPQQAVAEIVKPIVDGKYKDFFALQLAVISYHPLALKLLLDTLKNKSSLSGKELFELAVNPIDTIQDPKSSAITLWLLIKYFSEEKLELNTHKIDPQVKDAFIQFETSLKKLTKLMFGQTPLPADIRLEACAHALQEEYPFLSFEFCQYCLKETYRDSHYKLILLRISASLVKEKETQYPAAKKLIYKNLWEITNGNPDKAELIESIDTNEVTDSLRKTNFQPEKIEEVLFDKVFVPYYKK